MFKTHQGHDSRCLMHCRPLTISCLSISSQYWSRPSLNHRNNRPHPSHIAPVSQLISTSQVNPDAPIPLSCYKTPGNATEWTLARGVPLPGNKKHGCINGTFLCLWLFYKDTMPGDGYHLIVIQTASQRKRPMHWAGRTEKGGKKWGTWWQNEPWISQPQELPHFLSSWCVK